MTWRETQAAALDDQALELSLALEQLKMAEDVLELRGRVAACTELRATASLLRLERDQIVGEARELRRSNDVDHAPLPMSLTTRPVREARG